MTSAKFLGFFTPCQQFGPVYSTKITQPPLLRQTLAAPPPPRAEVICACPLKKTCAPSILLSLMVGVSSSAPSFVFVPNQGVMAVPMTASTAHSLSRTLPRTNGAIAVADSVAFGKYRTRGLFFDGHLRRIHLYVSCVLFWTQSACTAVQKNNTLNMWNCLLQLATHH